jgi:biopolymer transport protein ExbD
MIVTLAIGMIEMKFVTNATSGKLPTVTPSQMRRIKRMIDVETLMNDKKLLLEENQMLKDQIKERQEKITELLECIQLMERMQYNDHDR